MEFPEIKMVNLFLKLISHIYNEKIESLCVRLLYFLNTIDTYSLVVGTGAWLIIFPAQFKLMPLALALLFAVMTAKIADFYPVFVVLALPVMVILAAVSAFSLVLIIKLLLVNFILFFIIQFLFMGIPDSIVARDLRVAFIKWYNSLFTVAPTTVSFSMSLFFSFYISFCLLAVTLAKSARDYFALGLSAALLLISAILTRALLPKNHFSKFHKLDTPEKPFFKRAVILNIDGVRKDIFDALDLPTRDRLIREGASHPAGLETVYRALTNPAFASILTGTTPEIHGVRNNNLNQTIQTEGLPDIVPAIAYGSMHVKHFCKNNWETKIVSLPRYSVYKSDDIMVNWLKEDMLKRKEVRLFVADFSEADFLAHAYGSCSRQYKEALERIDKRIGDFLGWMKTSGISEDTAVIVCSDHGIAAIDHSYLIASSEKFVPFFIYGKGIKKGFKIERPGKIMDICCTVAYLLGVKYPSESRGQVFTEALVNSNFEAEEEELVSRFNRLKYDAEANEYHSKHAEIYQGDKDWWDRSISDFASDSKRSLRVLDLGCGNGFVAERFMAKGVNLREFVCADISEKMLEAAKKSLKANPSFSFTSNLNELKGSFDIITASSVFHHVVCPQKLASFLDEFLSEGAVIIGSHEPNQQAFKNKLFFVAATLYKKIGGGVTIDDKMVAEFNRLLRERFSSASPVCREEILQMVEYHSPLEQYERDIDFQRGFVPAEFLKSNFAGYDILLLETYSTFSSRPWLSSHRNIQRFLNVLFKLFFREGNLFRFVLRKQSKNRLD